MPCTQSCSQVGAQPCPHGTCEEKLKTEPKISLRVNTTARNRIRDRTVALPDSQLLHWDPLAWAGNARAGREAGIGS